MNGTNIPNELGIDSAPTSNVTPSEPVNTGSEPVAEPTVDAPAEAPAEAEAPVEETPAETPAAETPVEEAPEEPSLPSADYLKKLHESQQLDLPTDKPDIFDEYGNVDPDKFMAYQSARDNQIFNKALSAVNARQQAEAAEDNAWDTVYQTYPEIKTHNLDNALRGARIQDITAGGDGDLARLAKNLAAPFRTAKIEAVEQANKVVEQAESLETFKPTAAAAPTEAPSLMVQLSSAVREGNNERASQLRHAIRKARIYGKDK